MVGAISPSKNTISVRIHATVRRAALACSVRAVRVCKVLCSNARLFFAFLARLPAHAAAWAQHGEVTQDAHRGGGMLIRIFCLCLTICLAWGSLPALAWDARVVRVEDGNTISVSKTGKSGEAEVVLRFYGIEAPTLSQPFGAEARQRLAEIMPRGTRVTVEPVGESESGTISALIQVGGASVNYQLVMEGLAWIDRQNCRAIFCRRWMIQEHQAVVEKRGVWGLKIGTPPWQWGR